MAQWIDLTLPLRNGMVRWEGDPAPNFTKVVKEDGEYQWTVSAIQMGAHVGTHMDAPRHLLAKGASLDSLSFDATVGLARVIEIKDPVSVKIEHLIKARIRKGDRILFKTRNSPQCWQTDEFVRDYVYIEPDAAQFLVEQGVRAVGIDYLSVGSYYKGNCDTHAAFLKAGIWLIEGLNMTGVKPGKYDLICLPLRILGGDGAPARAIIRKRKY